MTAYTCLEDIHTYYKINYPEYNKLSEAIHKLPVYSFGLEGHDAWILFHEEMRSIENNNINIHKVLSGNKLTREIMTVTTKYPIVTWVMYYINGGIGKYALLKNAANIEYEQ